MNGTTHKIVGISLVAGYIIVDGVWSGSLLGIPTYNALMLATVTAGSIMADADMETTEMGRKMPWLSEYTTHRGITHTPAIMLIPLLIAFMLSVLGQGFIITAINSLILGFFIGYASHIFIDTFNYNGCPVFWPVYRKNMYIFRVSTANKRAVKLVDKKNNWQEPVFTGIWVIAIVIHVVLIKGGITL